METNPGNAIKIKCDVESDACYSAACISGPLTAAICAACPYWAIRLRAAGRVVHAAAVHAQAQLSSLRAGHEHIHLQRQVDGDQQEELRTKKELASAQTHAGFC